MSEIAPNAASASPSGLTTEEARRRLTAFGPNATPATFRRVASAFWAPVPWMLEAAIALQLAPEPGDDGGLGRQLVFLSSSPARSRSHCCSTRSSSWSSIA
jgi:hypothetical protein